MAEIDTSIYKQQPRNDLGTMNPAQLLGLAQGAMDFQANQAVGEEIRKAYDPNDPSGVDRQKLMRGLINHPNPLVQQHAQKAAQDIIATQSNAFGLNAAQMKYAADMFGTLAAKGDNVSVNDYAHAATLAARAGLPPDMVRQMLQGPGTLKEKALRLGNMSQGYNTTMTPTTATPGPAGEPIVAPLGEVQRRSVSGGEGGGMRSGVSPGFSQLSNDSVAGYNALKNSVNEGANRIALLENLKQESGIAGEKFSPWVKQEKNLNQLMQRFGIQDKVGTMSKDQLQALESFDKFANQIALAQSGATGAHGTDLGLNTQMGANPNSTMSKLGVQGVIEALQGNEYYLRARHNAFLNSGIDPADPKAKAAWDKEFNSKVDPRVFQFANMSPENKSKFRAALGGEAQGFAKRLKDARDAGWISPEGGPVR